MPEIRKSRELGFCSGVKKAIRAVEKLSTGTGGPVWTIGPLVHNPGVVASLERKGISPVGSVQDLHGRRGQAVIPAHGMALAQVEAVTGSGLPLHDSTCPIVGNLQQKVKKLSREGYAIVIFGEQEHPEVKGALGWVEDEALPAIATTRASDMNKLAGKRRRLALLSQTTQTVSSYTRFCRDVLKTCLPGMLEIKILNTICPEVKRRQSATRELARTSDLMIIVGGKGSSNTRRLAEISQDAGAQVFQVEEAGEIQPEWLRDRKCIGIAAGTSTPIESVEKVEMKLRELVSAENALRHVAD